MDAFIISLCSALGLNGIILFFIKRYFAKRDAVYSKEKQERDELYGKLNAGLETLRLLSYHRMSQEIERLLDQGFASPSERRVLDEMFENYKAHGWNGDMNSRLKKVYSLRTDEKE